MERLALDRWASPWLRNQHLARYRWAAGYAARARVLDAACGTAYGSRLLREAGAARVISLDRSLDAFSEARRGGGTGDLEPACADASALPIASGSVDLYTSFETVEHVEEDRALVSEAKRVLRPGGLFLCSTPNRELLSPGNTVRDRPANPYHVREYAIAEFRDLLAEAFASVVLYGQTFFSRGHGRRLARAGKHGNLFAVRLHQLRNVAGLLWERPGRHVPVPLDGVAEGRVPEVVIGLCRA